MTNQNTQNFLTALSNFKWPESVTVTYRLYYNEDGSPKCYTMEDLPGKYIEVDKETYVGHFWNVKVVQEKLQFIAPTATVQKIKPNTQDGVPCCQQDVCIIVSEDRPHTKWNKITNEIN